MTRIERGRGIARLRLEILEDRSVPTTFTVNTTLDDVTPTNGKFSLREAITKANTTPGADVIVMPPGVFKITIPGAGESGNLTGDFDITDTLTIQGAGAGITNIDGQKVDRVFDILGNGPSSIKVVLQGLTTRNGSVTGDGGGIRVGNADLVVRDCIVTGNLASMSGGGISNGAAPATGTVALVRATVGRNVAGTNGGGISVTGISEFTVKDSTIRRNVGDIGGGINADVATLTNCTVSGNFAAGAAGGISASSTATLTNCTVSGNTAATDIAGGIYAGTATLTGSIVSGNTAGGASGAGGGIFTVNPVSLTNCTVSGNSSAMNRGGGIFSLAAVTLIRSTISGNTASVDGGGIYDDTATVTLTNSTVSGNTAGNAGGGLFATTANLLNCTIVENVAHTGGGLFHNPGGSFNVRNTILALNLVDFTGTGPDVSGAFTSQGHNLIGAGGGGFVNGVDGNIVGTNTNPIDPKLGPLANNGGPTKTHALLAGSLAIDHGDNAGTPASDQRGFGFARKKDGNGDGVAVVDIGAFER